MYVSDVALQKLQDRVRSSLCVCVCVCVCVCICVCVCVCVCICVKMYVSDVALQKLHDRVQYIVFLFLCLWMWMWMWMWMCLRLRRASDVALQKRVVGSLTYQVSFQKEPIFGRAILQKRPSNM